MVRMRVVEKAVATNYCNTVQEKDKKGVGKVRTGFGKGGWLEKFGEQ